MQQFQVPQFIDIEDKIFGPLTIKQFIYVLGGTGLIGFLWLLGLPSVIFWPAAMLAGGFFGALAFMKVNGQPFITVLANALNHVTHPRLYVWKRTERKPVTPPTAAVPKEAHAPRLTESRLKNLSWSLDINEKLHR